MTPQIKQRIEQIRCGEVPAGYKKTKVGVVPNEWEETRFKKMFSRLSRKNKENNDNVLTISAQYGLISQRDFFNKDIASEDKSNYFLLHNGEFAYNKSYSNGYPFGALKRLDMYDKGIVSPLYICFSANENNECPDFYVHYFEAGMMNREIQAFAQEGARNHGLLNISVDDFFNSYLLMPPLPEQEKIAEILAAQDTLIALKEKLIEEKKCLKKALMQYIFSSDNMKDYTRLKLCAFMKESKVIAIPNIEKRLTVKLNLQGVEKRKVRTTEKENATVQYIRRSGQFIYGKQNFHHGAFGIVPDLLDGYQSSSDIPSFDIFNKNISVKWIYYWFSRKEIYESLEVLTSGTGSKRLNPETFLKIKIPVPEKNIQEKIIKIFDLVDNEIILLEKNIEQEKQKKKALMQLLLTGIVRV